MTPINKNIINKIVKLVLYNCDALKYSSTQDKKFCRNIGLYFKSSNEFIQIRTVLQESWLIEYFENKGLVPSENVKLAAVSNNSYVISLFENPSEQLQFAAINRQFDSIKYIENPYPSVIELYEKLSGKKYKKKYL
jgi:hypothetical protein